MTAFAPVPAFTARAHTRPERAPQRRWNAVYSSPFLTGRTEAEISDALPVVEPRRRSWTVDELAEEIAEFLEAQDRRAAYIALPRRHGYTEDEWRQIGDMQMAFYTDCCPMCKRLLRPTFDQTEDRDREQALIQHYETIVNSLLDYIASV